MRKLRMNQNDFITFEEGCNKYLDNCRQRNLRKDTISNLYKKRNSALHIKTHQAVTKQKTLYLFN